MEKGKLVTVGSCIAGVFSGLSLLGTIIGVPLLFIAIQNIHVEMETESTRFKDLSNIVQKEMDQVKVMSRNVRQFERFFVSVPSNANTCDCKDDNDCPEGPAGPAGPRGPTGFPGEMGLDGVPGLDAESMKARVGGIGRCLTCPEGPDGPVGPRGRPGTKGIKGMTGMSGMPGRSGIGGSRGSRGVVGPKGLNGLRGKPGIPGEDGSGGKGAPGPKGDPGSGGRQGRQGIKGERGYPGPIGPPGFNGLAGNRGKTGPPGKPGTVGRPARNGPDGAYCSCPGRGGSPSKAFPSSYGSSNKEYFQTEQTKRPATEPPIATTTITLTKPSYNVPKPSIPTDQGSYGSRPSITPAASSFIEYADDKSQMYNYDNNDYSHNGYQPAPPDPIDYDSDSGAVFDYQNYYDNSPSVKATSYPSPDYNDKSDNTDYAPNYDTPLSNNSEGPQVFFDSGDSEDTPKDYVLPIR